MRARLVTLLGAALLLSACASFNRLDNDVSTFGDWPAARKPASYVFERLPSQQAKPDEQKQQQVLEDAARGALQQAGFVEAGAPPDAEYVVQLGARVVGDTPWIYNDPLFWRGGFRWGYYGGWHGRGWRGAGWSYGAGFGPGWGGFGPYDYAPNFSREIALVIRDRRTNQVLYEARAENDGPSAAIDRLLPAMFQAAMQKFPAVEPKPQRVTVPIDPSRS